MAIKTLAARGAASVSGTRRARHAASPIAPYS